MKKEKKERKRKREAVTIVIKEKKLTEKARACVKIHENFDRKKKQEKCGGVYKMEDNPEEES